MMLKIVIFICAIVVINEASARKYSGSSMPKGFKLFDNDEDLDCTKPGYSCKNCTHSQYCLDLGNDNWIGGIEECEKDETCNIGNPNGECSKENNPECDEIINSEYIFKCHVPGLFPDPFNCSKYHMCVTENDTESTKFVCNEGFEYDSLTTLCSKHKETDKSCDRMMGKTCTKIGDEGPIEGNRNMYFVCLYVGEERVLWPQIFNCADGKQYIKDEDKYKCKELPPWNKNTETNILNICIKTQTYYNPENCKEYVKCESSKLPDLKNCEEDDPVTYFDRWEGKCVNNNICSSP